MINKPYLIAEIGINHNGSLKLQKNLLIMLKDSGFDAVKFQKRTIDIVYDKATLERLEKVRGEKLLENKN
jgi:N-acetylneuraminate synthase